MNRIMTKKKKNQRNSKSKADLQKAMIKKIKIKETNKKEKSNIK